MYPNILNKMHFFLETLIDFFINMLIIFSLIITLLFIYLYICCIPIVFRMYISYHKYFICHSYWIHEGESVNRSQMGIKRKICDIRIWKKHLFLEIFSTNIDTLVPSLYRCVETRIIQVFWLLSQPLPHLRFNVFAIGETFAPRWLVSRPERWRSLGANFGP
jgi:hypothetical protein